MKHALSSTVILFIASVGSSAPPPPVTAIAYHPDGKFLAAGTYKEVALIDPAKGDVLGKLSGQSHRVTALAFSKNGDRLAAASGEPAKSGQIRLYEFKNGEAKLLTTKLDAHADAIYSLVFSPDGKLLASAGYDRIIKLWDTTGNADPKLLQDHSDTIYGLSFHPDGKLLASVSADRAVKVWNIETGKRLYTLSDSTDWVYAVGWSPDGQRLAAGGIDKSIRVWEADASGGKLIHSVFAHTQPITRIVWSKDGNTLYSCGEGKIVKSWNAATMKEKLVFPPQLETVLSLALAPDQKQIAVGRFDGVLLLLNTEDGKTVSQPLPAKPKPPVLQKLTPNSGVRGETARIIFEGDNLDEASEIVAEAGIMAKIIAVGRTSKQVYADVVLPAEASPGLAKLTLKSPAGNSASLPFFVDRHPAVSESGRSDSPRIGTKVKLPATLVGSIHKAGDADYYRFDVSAGQEIAVQALTAAIGSKLEPNLELTDENGKVLTESVDGLLGYICPRAGTLSLGIRDREFRGAGDFTYRIGVGDFPIVTGITPLSVERGKESAFDLLGVNLGANRRILFKAPSDAMPGAKIAASIPKTKEPALGTPRIVVGEFPELPVVRDGVAIPVPGTATGVIHAPGTQQMIGFHAIKGQRLIVEVEARRLGSPLDSVVEIVDGRGHPVMRATLRCVARAFSTFRDNDSASSGIRLEAWNELAMDDFLYVNGELMRIKELPKGPDDDCQFYAVAGQRVGFLDTTPRHHANGSTMYKVEFHPPGSSFPPNGMPVFNIGYRNDDGGSGFGKDSRIFFDPPSDGDYIVRIGDARGQGGIHFAYRLTVRAPASRFLD